MYSHERHKPHSDNPAKALSFPGASANCWLESAAKRSTSGLINTSQRPAGDLRSLGKDVYSWPVGERLLAGTLTIYCLGDSLLHYQKAPVREKMTTSCLWACETAA